VQYFNSVRFDPERIREQSFRFDKEVVKEKIEKFIEKKFEEHTKNLR